VSGRCGHGRHGARPGEEEEGERRRRRRPAAAAVPARAVAAPVRMEIERERERERPRGEGERKLGEDSETRSGSPSIYLPGQIRMRSQGSRDEAAEKPDKAGKAASDGTRFERFGPLIGRSDGHKISGRRGWWFCWMEK